MHDDDAKLVARALAGDAGAFEEIVARYATLVGGIAVGIVGDVNAAADVSQDVFLKAYRRLERLKDPARLKSWLGHIAHSTAIDWRRRRKHWKLSLDDALRADGLTPETDVTRAIDPSAAHERQEQRRAVIGAIEGLPGKYREVVVLKHLRGMTYQEIGELKGLTVSAVESRLYRARALLRRRLERLDLL